MGSKAKITWAKVKGKTALFHAWTTGGGMATSFCGMMERNTRAVLAKTDQRPTDGRCKPCRIAADERIAADTHRE